MSVLAIVDSLPSATAVHAADPAARLATDNPLLAADPRRPAPIENLDALISPQEAFEIGRGAVRLAIDADARLAADKSLSERAGGTARLSGHSTRTFASLIYRAVVLARAVQRFAPSSILVHAADASDHERGAPVLPSRFLAPAVPLATNGFFGEIPVEVTRVPVELPRNFNETSIKDVFRRAAMLPLPVLLLEAWVRLRGRHSGPFDFVLHSDNDPIREALPVLAWRGLKWRPSGKAPVAEAKASDELAALLEKQVAMSHAPWLAGQTRAVAADLSARQAEIMAALLVRYLSAGLASVAVTREPMRQWMEGLFAERRGNGKILVTGGLFGPGGALLHSVAKEQGVTIVTFEHGVTKGLAALAASRPEASETKLADWFLGCSPNAIREHRQDVESGRLRFCAIGLPDHTKSTLRRPIQRLLARRALGLRGGKSVVMHVATWPYHGNHRSGPGVPPETSVFDIDRTLLEKVYSGLPHQVLFKPYPTQRFVHEPDYREIFKPSEGVRFVDRQDFRYVRAAADVIVTTNPTSTFGWCVGAGVPIVWLDSKWLTPLAGEELRQSFRDSFFVVDIDAPDWADRLHELLSGDIETLQRDWRSKKTVRQAFLEFAVTGPKGAMGRRGAAAVIEALHAH
jgi:hypothetical protein